MNIDELENEYVKLIVKKGLNVQENQEVMIYANLEIASFVYKIVECAYQNKASKVSVEWMSETLKKLNNRYQSVEALGKVEKWQEERYKHRVEALPCRLFIESDDPDGLKDIDQEKESKARQMVYQVIKPYVEALDNKEQWCIVGYPSLNWAKKVFPQEKDEVAKQKLLEAILKTSRVEGDAIENWKKHSAFLHDRCQKLNAMHLKELHYTSSNGTDFTVGLIDGGLFAGGSETTLTNIEINPNIPSEECYTSPLRTQAEGIVYATKPLSYNGELIEDFSITFKNGKVTEVHAKKGEELLKKMVSMDEGASYLGECALIPFDSPINNTGILFYSTLYDENASCHLALGRGFTNLLVDYEKYTLEEIYQKGINRSMIHVDFMIGNKDLNIVGTTYEGEQIQIFKDGNWAF